MQRFSRLISIASAVVDVTTFIPHLPDRGGDVLSTESMIALGGAFNAESAAARLGLPVLHFGSAGTGPNSKIMLEALTSAGIEFHGKVYSEDVGFCFTMVEPDGQRTFVTTTGAEAHLEYDQLHKIDLKPTDAVYLSGYDLVYPKTRDAIERWLKGDHLNGAALFFDTTPLVGDIDAEALEIIRRDAFLIACNETEFDIMQPRTTDRALFARRIGAQGCELYECAELKMHVPVDPVTPFDTTGAGDVQLGSLIALLAEGRGWRDAIALANKAAALAVMVPGGATGPTREELGI